MINNVYKYLKAIKLKSPEKCDILILDYAGSDILKRMILKDIDSFVLHSCGEIFYLTPGILARIFLNFIKSAFKKKPVYLMTIYLLSCIQKIKPAIIITFIDNSIIYQQLSRNYPEAEFYFIANGTRSTPVINNAGYFSLTNLMCWSKNEVDYHKRCGSNVDKFYTVGPLIGAYYKHEASLNNGHIDFDICVVSQFRREIINGTTFPLFKYSMEALDDYLSRFINKNNLSTVIATCSSDPSDLQEEIEYFKKKYKNLPITIVKQDRNNLSTYSAMDKSSVIIAVCSSAAYEAYHWGKKVLMCNFSKDQCYDSFLLDEFTVKQDYAEFELKLDRLLKMDYNEYYNLTKENSEYVTGSDYDVPAHIYIRNIIIQKLESK
jgi:surface carbohydrate biosynthesis protein